MKLTADWVILVATALLLGVLVVACSSCESLPAQWVTSDRLTFEAVAPELERWQRPVACDSCGAQTYLYSEPEREDLAGLARAWQIALEAAEELIGGER